MGLRDRLRLLLRPGPGPVVAPRARETEASPPTPPEPPPVRVPRAVASAPFGAQLIDVGTGPVAPGATRVPPERWPTLRGPVCVTSPNDGGEWASAVAERLAASGVEATWVQGGTA